MFFFWCLSMFGASSGLFFFVFFGACQCFRISHVKIMMKKVCFTGVLDPPNAWNIGIYSVFSSFLMKIHSPTGCRPQKKTCRLAKTFANATHVRECEYQKTLELRIWISTCQVVWGTYWYILFCFEPPFPQAQNYLFMELPLLSAIGFNQTVCLH